MRDIASDVGIGLVTVPHCSLQKSMCSYVSLLPCVPRPISSDLGLGKIDETYGWRTTYFKYHQHPQVPTCDKHTATQPCDQPLGVLTSSGGYLAADGQMVGARDTSSHALSLARATGHHWTDAVGFGRDLGRDVCHVGVSSFDRSLGHLGNGVIGDIRGLG